MKRFISIMFFMCMLVSLQAQEIYTVKNIPKVHLQDKTRYVCNPAGILSAPACDEMDRMLYALEQQTGIETVVAAVPSIGSEDCFDFAHRLLNEWGVGKKEKNNGLVILLVTDQRCIQFYTGYGLEGDLPDAICKRIQTRDMIPYLKDGNWDAGMTAGIRAVCARLDGSMENDTEEEEDLSATGIFLLCFGIIGIGLFTVILAMRAATKCPNCGQHKLQRSGSKLVSRRNGVRTEDVTYTCRNCGHKVVRRQQSYDENYRGGGGSGPVIFGGGGFGSGGGGFSGGSFGGGMGGGGGAGSRF
ncbi:YgcG family protein [uncultured Bacteroides sp.]|uniref:TPM domain-containing protein n=2 Tax=uncultured Bacteroides sp. TaxID=162156 RepID=UPI00263024E4|nr:TPM domain-containing protein [uncultured Bacteroides sp.]